MTNVLLIGGNGYIGSFLAPYLTLHGLTVTTYGNKTTDYNLLTQEFLADYSYIILLAGHSGVAMSNGNVEGVWNNNVRNFDNLVHKLTADQKLIFASSASVYGNNLNRVSIESDIAMDFINNYDLTKASLDLLAQKYITDGRNILGFRFGTVNGGSRLVRLDLMLNNMVYCALYEKKILVTNIEISRPILHLVDLGRAMLAVIDSPFIPGIYNLASFTNTVGNLARQVQKIINVPIVHNGSTPGAYDFKMSSSKFNRAYNFSCKSNAHLVIHDLITCYKTIRPGVVIRDQYFEYNG
jgi:nucleoside-diphosphate-sugar epimerase